MAEKGYPWGGGNGESAWNASPTPFNMGLGRGYGTMTACDILWLSQGRRNVIVIIMFKECLSKN